MKIRSWGKILFKKTAKNNKQKNFQLLNRLRKVIKAVRIVQEVQLAIIRQKIWRNTKLRKQIAKLYLANNLRSCKVRKLSTVQQDKLILIQK